MHPYLIDWLRNVRINPDARLAELRWKTAKSYAKGLTHERVARLVRLFLFPQPDASEAKSFTDALLLLDNEFPVANNAEELRLMAGVVMLTQFSESSYEGDAFGLGLRAASFPGRNVTPAQPAIVKEAEEYLLREGDKQRPTDFHNSEDGGHNE